MDKNRPCGSPGGHELAALGATREGVLTMRLWISLGSNEAIVVGVAADPVPDHAIFFHDR
jgi:hypothetical protein